MAVPAIELKPRGPLALFDAAIRVVARTSGVWALTLPGGALLTWAVLGWVEAISGGRALIVPTLLLAFAWIARGLFMAATCAYLERQLLEIQPPTTWWALRAALARLPSIVITAAYLPVFTALTLTFTLGIGFFFLTSHLAAWAAVMKGLGHPLALYGTCARLLGPSRGNATVIRCLFGVIVLVALNLHIAANALIYVGRKLVGLDLTYAQRFVSLDNAAWVTVVLALAFTLFEPLRAAVATLLLIDGRVRQDGLDLLASVEQLPRRNTVRPRPTGSAGAAAALVLIVVTCLVSSEASADEDRRRHPHFGAGSAQTTRSQDLRHEQASMHGNVLARAHAQPLAQTPAQALPMTLARAAPHTQVLRPAGLLAQDQPLSQTDVEPQPQGRSLQLLAQAQPTQQTNVEPHSQASSAPPAPEGTLVQRLNAVAAACEYESAVLDSGLGGVDALPPPEQRALRRLVHDVELSSFTWEDCDAVVARLDAALPLLSKTVDKANDPVAPGSAASHAQAILSRPEFVPAQPPPKVAPEETPEDEKSWWSSLVDRFFEWLKAAMESDRRTEVAPRSAVGAGLGAANAIAMVLLVAVLAVVAVLLYLAFRSKGAAATSVEVERASAEQAVIPADSALARPPEGWSALADELAAAGNFREAVRSLYLALLARLHGVGAIDYDPTLSNWDYCRQFRGHREWVPAFRELTSRFDFAWYGKADVGHHGYQAFRQLTEPMLRPAPVGDPSGTPTGQSGHA